MRAIIRSFGTPWPGGHTVVLVACAVMSMVRVYGQACPTRELEAIRGLGSNAKVGFLCGTGCDTRYYLSANALTSQEVTVIGVSRVDSNCGTFEDHSEGHHKRVSGNNLTAIVVSFDPLTCSMTTSNVTASTNIETHSVYSENSTSACREGVVIWSCESLSVDGALKYGAGCTDWPSSTGMVLVSSSMSTGGCGEVRSTYVYEYVWNNGRTVLTDVSSTTPGYHDEYTTELAILRAKQCAYNVLNSQSLDSGHVIDGQAVCNFALASDQSAAEVELAQWRLKISGTIASQKYIIDLYWKETVRGKTRFLPPEPREAIAPDQPTWYYPGPSGELLKPSESTECGYTYSRELVDAKIRPK
ncbi:MAG: hypothetical protein KJ072_26980 [Verrucomicrobia bacterium]|nr:hypothetical protein [Verrucomicrobiota bacterium]